MLAGRVFDSEMPIPPLAAAIFGAAGAHLPTVGKVASVPDYPLVASTADPGACSQRWPRWLASLAKCAGVPTTRLNFTLRVATSSYQLAASTPIRVRIGER